MPPLQLEQYVLVMRMFSSSSLVYTIPTGWYLILVDKNNAGTRHATKIRCIRIMPVHDMRRRFVVLMTL